MLSLDHELTPFLPNNLGESEMGGSAENPFLLENEEDKENSTPTSPVFERSKLTLRCWDVVFLEQELEIFLNLSIEFLFNYY